jgi:hypothetical protein
MKLYEISEEFKELEALIDSGELTKEQAADTLDAIEVEFEEKIKNCLFIRQQYLADAAAYSAEIDRLSALKSDAESKADNLLNYVKINMLKLGKDKMKAGVFWLTLRKPTKKLGGIDESIIPEKYFDEVPATKKLNKRLLLSDAKKTDIEGVNLIDSERSLTVK